MKIGKKALSLILALTMVVSTFVGTAAFAEDNNASTVLEIDSTAADVTVTSSKELVEAIEAAQPNQTILVNGTIGSQDNYTSYEITKAITITSSSDAIIYGSFEIKTDGVKINGLKMYTRGGGNGPLKAAIDVIAKNVTITNNTFELPNPSDLAKNGGIGNGVTIWPNGDGDVSYNITGNTFKGYKSDTADWSSTALQIVEGLDLARFNMSGTISGVVNLGNTEKDLAIGNSYEDCSNNYVHSYWSNGMEYKYVLASTADQLSSLEFAGVGATILIGNNISDIKSSVVVDKKVTIDGGGHTLTFTSALNTLSNGEQQGILVEANGVTISNLTVHMAGDANWQGVYGIQVYNATEVILNNVTASGTDAALLVNGSAVTLTGVTTVTGNKFGGIEVSKGTGLTNSELIVTGTLVNGSEAYGQPTIWLVKDQGTVTGTNVPATTNITLKTDQTQYYTDAVNSGASTLDAVKEALDQVKNLTPSNTLDDEDKADIKAAIEAVLGLNDAAKQTLNNDDIKKLDELLAVVVDTNVTKTIAPPVTDSITTSSDKLTVLPTVSGLLLAAGITGNEPVGTKVTLTTKQVATQGSEVLAFELSLKKDTQEIHDLAVPVTVTITFPSSFVYNPSLKDYKIQHVKHDGTSEDLPLTISRVSGAYTGTFTTSSFSTFTVVETPDPDDNDNDDDDDNDTSTATFVSDTTVDFNVNGAYQFKITSANGQVPTLVVGTSGVFTTLLVKTVGNDYYFKLTAVGNTGAKAGIYVNGVKLLVATVVASASTVKSDTTLPFNVKVGKAYTFKLTAESKPTFVAGTSSAFKVEFVKAVGKDYFFKATAVGKADLGSGFYINSLKTPVTVATITK